MKKGKQGLMSRRDFIRAAGVGTLAAGIAPQIILPGRGYGAGKALKLLVWSHFVPRFDKEWFDGYAKNWGQANGVNVTVDHIGLAEIPARTAAEISAGQGHDLIEGGAPAPRVRPRL